MQRRILQSFRLDEISAVDRPAQEHALAVITKTASGGDAPAEFDAAVRAIVERDRCPCTVAMSKVRVQRPDLFAKLQHASPAGPVAKGKSKAVTDFEALVDDIASRRKIPRTAAMQAARRENPAMFSAFQNA